MKIIKLGDLVNIRTGKLDANASDIDGIYPFFTCSVTPLRINTYTYDTECVLVAGNGDLNVKYYNGKFDAYQRTYIIESKDKQLLDVKYLYYFLDKYVEKLRSQSIGGVIKYIKLGNLTDALIPVFSIEVQREIVNILEMTRVVIEKRQAQITALDELINAYFYETLKTDLKSLELNDLIVKTQNGMSRRGNDEDGQIVLKLKNVKNNIVDFDSINRIDLTERELSTYQLDKDDLLLVRVNGNPKYVGRNAVFTGYREPVYFNDHIIRVKVANVNVEYLSYLLNSNLGISEIQKNIKTSAGQYTISRDGLNKIKLKLPNEIVQKEFITKKDIIDSKKAKLKNSIESLETLYNSLLQKAFKGELFQEQV